MGVHTTFVRSVDLDEWTQRQIDAMRLGGNANASTYFRKHGATDLHAKIEKKYKSKAAQNYRHVLQKMVEAEAAKRGEAVESAPADAAANAGSLMENLSLLEQKQEEAAAKATTNGSASATVTAQSKAVKASELPGAKGRLVTPPSSGNAPRVVLRKPASSGNTLNLIKKKPSNVGSKLRVNKLSGSSISAKSGSDDEEVFEDIETTQKAAAENERQAKQLEEDEAMARQMQKELDRGGSMSHAVSAPTLTTTTTAPIQQQPSPLSAKSPAQKLQHKQSSMEENMARLKADNDDFFANM
jgi:ADP-ribosylation factor GTPase-activating protein 2/3